MYSRQTFIYWFVKRRSILHPSIHFRINLSRSGSHGTWVSPSSHCARLTLDKSPFYHHVKTHIDKQIHSHSLLICSPSLSPELGELKVSIPLQSFSSVSPRQTLEIDKTLDFWGDGEDFQKCIKHQAIKYRPGGVKFTATLPAPQLQWPV